MTNEQWFDSHKNVSDFTDGETVHLFVDGFGEVVTTYKAINGELWDNETGESYGSLEYWLWLTIDHSEEKRGVNNSVMCPPGLETASPCS